MCSFVSFWMWENVFVCVYMCEHVSLHPCCAWVRMLGECWCVNVWIVYLCENICVNRCDSVCARVSLSV